MTPTDGQAVRVRLAPSPTGHLHIGTARTGLFNWLFARQRKGTFVIRIEDTDRGRSDKKYENEILEGLLWLGLNWDEGPTLEGGEKGEYGPYRQSERGSLHRTYLEKLLREKKAYYCYCAKEELEAERQARLGEGLPPKYGGHCRELHSPPPGRTPSAIRFKTPEGIVTFKDIVRGTVSFDAGLFGDMVIAKNIETPLYNFAVVVDDAEMRISHVIRGEDHLPNTPKQILMQKALGFTEPAYAHLPLILGKNREKLSKRYMETSLLDYRSRGYLKEAVMNFLALLGWHPSHEKEIFTPDDLIQEFDVKRLQKAGAVFDEEKLEWINAQHLKQMTDDEVAERLVHFLNNRKEPSHKKELLRKIVAVERERIKTFGNFFETAGFFFALPDYEPPLLRWKDASLLQTKEMLENIARILREVQPEDWKRGALSRDLAPPIKERGRGEVFWPLRVAVSGRAASPDPLDIMEVLGKEETLRRIDIAVRKLESALGA